MNNKQMIAIGTAIVLIIGGVGAFLIVNSANNSDSGEKEFVDYDSSKGWASWDPKVFKFSSSLMGASPFVVNTAEEMYEGIYGDLPTNTGITIDDVPSDFYKHRSLVSYNSDGKLVVQSFAMNASQQYEPRDVVFDSVADYNMAPGSFVATLYYVMSYAAGIDPTEYDSKVVSDLWSKVNAGTYSTYDDIEVNFGIPKEGFNGYKMPHLSASDILGSSEDYVKVIESVADEGKSTVYFGYGSMNSWSNGGTWLTELAESKGSYVILGQFATVNETLALVEAMAHIYGMKEIADDIIDDIRLRLYTL
ncbi:MAG: hypothetical protein LBR42_02685, partial [Candidatus Methanoplasma sp.]|nr:hypothetical protein [Candidatus Methanoplasma sp.]